MRTTGRHVEVQGASSSTDNSSRSACPVSGCKAISKKLKHHAYRKHLPVVFRDVTFPRAEIDPNFQQITGDALQTLARWILEDQTGTVFGLVHQVNEHNIVPRHAEILERQVIEFQV